MDIWVQNTQRKPRFNQKSPPCDTLQSGFADNLNGWCDRVLEAKPADQEYHAQYSYSSEVRDKQKWEEFIATGPTFQEVLTEVLSYQWVITTTINTCQMRIPMNSRYTDLTSTANHKGNKQEERKEQRIYKRGSNIKNTE